MSSSQKKFYITTPIYYVNASPHIGHTYTTVGADILARYHRMIGEKVFFLTGTDEHGAKIEEKAREAGKEPKEFADEVAAEFMFAWDELNISHDRFIRTTEEAHIKAVENALQFMYDKGDIYLGKYKGLYCQGCEQYLNEKDLIDGLCPDHKTIPQKMSEESYIFRMSKYHDEILEKIKKDEFKILPAERKNEILSFLKNEKLQDISFSRKKVKWGISLPWDKSHTAYVWADAFLNYLTGLGREGKIPLTPFMQRGRNLPNPLYTKETYKKSPLHKGDKGDLLDFWPPDLQLMSKDILRVHATIWPAMLMSLGIDLPKTLFIHGFFMIDGQKMSKSLGNVITPADLVKRYGVDGARYLIASAASFGSDGDVSWEKFDEKYNADLANGLGNLVARVLTMTEKYFNGKVPSNIKSREVFMKSGEFKISDSGKGDIGGEMPAWLSTGSDVQYYMDFMKNFDIFDALYEMNIWVGKLDKYISDYKPFKLIKEDTEKTAAVLYNCLESLRIIAWMLWPFMPDTAEKIYSQLGLDLNKEMQKKDYKFEEVIKWGGLPADAKAEKSEILFPRIS